MLNVNKRIEWIDNAKGFAAMLVICLHIPNYDICKDLISSFVLPMFFILSGITFSLKHESFIEYFKKKIIVLIWPSFILCGVLNTIIEFTYSSIIGIEYKISLKNIILGTILQMRGSYDFGVWFLICLFTSQIIMYFLIKYLIRNNKHIFCFMVLFYILANIYSVCIHKALPWSLDVALIGVSYLLLGYFMKETMLMEKLLESYLSVFIFIAMFLIGNYINIITKSGVNLYLNYLGNPIVQILTVIGGCGAIVILCNKIKGVKILGFIGKNSLIIYCMQYSLIFILDRTLHVNFLLLELFIYFVLTLMGTMLIAYIITRFFPFLIGRKKKCVVNGEKIRE